MKPKITLLLVLAGLSAACGQTIAASGTPTEVVRGMLGAVIAIQSDPGLQGQESRAARRVEIKKVILGNFTFDEMAREALGRYWNTLDGSRRSEFTSVFQDLFLDSYSRLVLDFVRKEKIVYVGEDSAQSGTMVKTLMQRTNEEIPVDYYLTQVGGGLKVRDVSIDGVSIVGNYRNSFSRIIKQESYESLLKKMKLQQQTLGKS
jgi:phospholipid transport system substrate-binding protein